MKTYLTRFIEQITLPVISLWPCNSHGHNITTHILKKGPGTPIEFLFYHDKTRVTVFRSKLRWRQRSEGVLMGLMEGSRSHLPKKCLQSNRNETNKNGQDSGLPKVNNRFNWLQMEAKILVKA